MAAFFGLHGPGVASRGMFDHVDLAAIQDFATALLIGALIGVEREKRKADGEPGIGGLRTFILFALVGAVAGFLSRDQPIPWVLMAALVPVAFLVFAGYWLVTKAQPGSFGLTTEIAAVVVCLLGAMTMLGHRELAIGLGVVTAAMLAYKQPLHGLVAKLGWDDVFAGVRLLIATFIILPLLPDRTLDPWDALNPYKLWLLVILISSLSLRGLRRDALAGRRPRHRPDRHHRRAGLLDGGDALLRAPRPRRAQRRKRPRLWHPARLGGDVRARPGHGARGQQGPGAPLLLAVHRSWVRVSLAAAWLLYRRSGDGTESKDVPLRNPFSLTSAAKFAVLFAAVLLLVKLAQFYLPGGGVYVLAALAGLTDVDAITLSMAEYAKSNPVRRSRRWPSSSRPSATRWSRPAWWRQ